MSARASTRGLNIRNPNVTFTNKLLTGIAALAIAGFAGFAGSANAQTS